MWRNCELWLKKFQMPIYLCFWTESTRKSATYDFLIDFLVQSVGSYNGDCHKNQKLKKFPVVLRNISANSQVSEIMQKMPKLLLISKKRMVGSLSRGCAEYFGQTALVVSSFFVIVKSLHSYSKACLRTNIIDWNVLRKRCLLARMCKVAALLMTGRYSPVKVHITVKRKQ